jgi:hypothetical protein
MKAILHDKQKPQDMSKSMTQTETSTEIEVEIEGCQRVAEPDEIAAFVSFLLLSTHPVAVS